jgi:uncharacterized membrane protein
MDGNNSMPTQTPNPVNNVPPTGGGPANDSAFWRFQGNQFILLIIYGVVVRIVDMILGGGFLGLIATLLNIAGLVLLVILIINVVNKKMKPLPVIGTLFTFIK